MILALLVHLLIGALAGWLAGKLMKGSGFGLLGNMAVGIIGAVIGGIVADVGQNVAGLSQGDVVTTFGVPAYADYLVHITD